MYAVRVGSRALTRIGVGGIKEGGLYGIWYIEGAGLTDTVEQAANPAKPCFFVGSSREDLREMPEDVRDVFGKAIHQAQQGGKAGNAKPLHGYRGAGVLEVVDDYDSDTYRAIYTVRLAGAVYVLHAFQKKSKSGIATSKHDTDLIDSRLKDAEAHHAQWLVEQKQSGSPPAAPTGKPQPIRKK